MKRRALLVIAAPAIALLASCTAPTATQHTVTVAETAPIEQTQAPAGSATECLDGFTLALDMMSRANDDLMTLLDVNEHIVRDEMTSALRKMAPIAGRIEDRTDDLHSLTSLVERCTGLRFADVLNR